MSKWQFDTSHSHISFRVKHMLFAKVRGKFGSWQGHLELEPGQLASAKVQVTIEAASIDTGTPDRDNHLRSPDFFAAAEFPQLTFHSTAVTQIGEGLNIAGDLTIRGVTLPVLLRAEKTGEGTDPWGNRRLGFAAHTKISRKAYGLLWNQLLETGGAVVADEVEIDIDVEAMQPAG